MFLEERQNAIAAEIAERGRVTVSALAAEYDVTADCIRKDLKQLEERGLARRVYGGAIAPAAAPEREVRKRVDTCAEAKLAIARMAYDLIAPDDCIYLDVSSTTLALARLVAEGPKPVTAVSNMIEILRVLGPAPHVKAIGTGGYVSPVLDGFLGSATLDMISNIRFDKAFLGTLGIDPETGAVSTYDLDDAAVKRAAMDNAQRAYLLADATKLGRPGTFSYGNVSGFDAVVTDASGPGLEKAAGLDVRFITKG